MARVCAAAFVSVRTMYICSAYVVPLPEATRYPPSTIHPCKCGVAQRIPVVAITDAIENVFIRFRPPHTLRMKAACGITRSDNDIA